MPPNKVRSGKDALEEALAQVKRQFGWNGSKNPFLALYSRFGGTIVSVVTISASNPLFFARSINW